MIDGSTRKERHGDKGGEGDGKEVEGVVRKFVKRMGEGKSRLGSGG